MCTRVHALETHPLLPPLGTPIAPSCPQNYLRGGELGLVPCLAGALVNVFWFVLFCLSGLQQERRSEASHWSKGPSTRMFLPVPLVEDC